MSKETTEQMMRVEKRREVQEEDMGKGREMKG